MLTCIDWLLFLTIIQSINSSTLSLLYGPISHLYMTIRITTALTIWTCVRKMISLPLNILFRLALVCHSFPSKEQASFNFMADYWLYACVCVLSHFSCVWLCFGLFPTLWLGCLLFWYWVVWAACVFWKVILCQLFHSLLFSPFLRVVFSPCLQFPFLCKSF